jgi:hypothetical protein
MKLKYTLVAVLLLGRCGHKPKQATPDCFQLAGSLKQTREAEFTREPVWVPCSPRAERFMNGKPEGGRVQ